MKTVRLTVAQALIKFLDNQYIEFDGKVTKFVEGIFGIFGHGNVLGIGQALEQDSGNLIVRQGRNEQGMAHVAIGFAKKNLGLHLFRRSRRRQHDYCRRHRNRQSHSASSFTG